jgi:molecular chaperone GrpE (heat shock protein)
MVKKVKNKNLPETNVLKIGLKLKDIKLKRIPVYYYRITPNITYIESKEQGKKDSIKLIVVNRNSNTTIITKIGNVENTIEELKSKFEKLKNEIENIDERLKKENKKGLTEILNNEILQKKYINIYYIEKLEKILQKDFKSKELHKIEKLIKEILELSKKIEKIIEQK